MQGFFIFYLFLNEKWLLQLLIVVTYKKKFAEIRLKGISEELYAKLRCLQKSEKVQKRPRRGQRRVFCSHFSSF